MKRVKLGRTAIRAATLAILAAAAVVAAMEPRDVSLETRRAAIRAELDRIPTRLGTEGRWRRVRDVPIPTSQARMLDLNGYLSRQYQLLGLLPDGVEPPVKVTMLLCHSIDARSMAGHHPPNCYPSSGWFMHEGVESAARIAMPVGPELQVARYQFSRGEGGASIWVVNGFLLPDGTTAAKLSEASRILGRAETSRLGLAQFQLIFDGGLPADVVDGFAVDILSSLPSKLLASIGGAEDTMDAVVTGELP